MAISPDEVPSVAPDESPMVDELEVKIDVWLCSEYPKGQRLFILPAAYLSGNGLEELCRRYTKAGWHVKYRSSQKENEQGLEFSPNPNRKA